jgi:hypothetical protein
MQASFGCGHTAPDNLMFRSYKLIVHVKIGEIFEAQLFVDFNIPKLSAFI